MSSLDRAPTFWRRASAAWLDFILLLCAYMVLGFISERLFLEDAYPPASGMDLYSARDFAVYWFFVRWILFLTAAYLLVSYKVFGATLGQTIAQIRVRHSSGEALSNKNIFLRVAIVLFMLILVMVPGPVVAILFLIIGSAILNGALSVALLLGVVLYFFYRAFTRYNRGEKLSTKDKLSGTAVFEVAKPID